MSGKLSAPEASIVIRCLNEADHIGQLFEGLKEQCYRNFEVIVVDSGSTDGTLDIVREQDDVELLHIEKERFSFGRSLNMGCEATSGTIVVAVSAHCYPANTFWLSNLLEDFSHARTGIVYGKQRGNNSSHFSEGQIFEKWFPNQSQVAQDGPFCNNANAAFRRDLWEDTRFDEELTGLEDIAFAQAVIRNGYQVNYRADAEVIHVHNEVRTQTRNRYRREAIALQSLFPEEHFNIFDFGRLYVRNVLTDARRALVERRFREEIVDIMGFRLAQFWGAYRGFQTRRPVSSSLKRHLYYPDVE